MLHTPGQKDSITLEPYQPLQLEITPPEVLTITDALLHLSVPEIIPGVWSEGRKTNVDATKQTFIEILPEMLVLHLKRFTYDGVSEKVVKKGKVIAYGLELVIPLEVVSPPRRAEASRLTYKLIGGELHFGSIASSSTRPLGTDEHATLYSRVSSRKRRLRRTLHFLRHQTRFYRLASFG